MHVCALCAKAVLSRVMSCICGHAVHGPKDVTPSEELVAIAKASAAAAAAHTTQKSQGAQGAQGEAPHVGYTAQLAQQQPQQDASTQGHRPQAQADTDALNRLARLQQPQPTQVWVRSWAFAISMQKSSVSVGKGLTDLKIAVHAL